MTVTSTRLQKALLLLISLWSLPLQSQSPAPVTLAPSNDEQTSPVTIVGSKIGNHVFGIDAIAGYAHGAILLGLEKFQNFSTPDLTLGVGACGASKNSYSGGFVTLVGGSKTGAGFGLNLRTGVLYGPISLGVLGQAVAGTKNSHAEIFLTLGIRISD
jgi:hypothetical protein